MDINAFISPEILATLQTGGYFLMFGLMIAEWPFVTMGAAFLASTGIFNIFLVALLGWLGDTIGDIFLFCIGRFWMSFFAKKREINTEKKENFMKNIELILEKNFFLALIIIKFTPYAPMIALPYLGILKNISVKKFLLTTTILSIPVPLIVAIIGFHINKIQYIFSHIPKEYHIVAILGIIIILIFLAIILYFLINFLKKCYHKKIQKILQNTKNS